MHQLRSCSLCCCTAGADVEACRSKPDVACEETLSASNIAEKLQNEFVISATVKIITGPPNGPVLFCKLTSVVVSLSVVCNAAGCQAHGNAAWELCWRSDRLAARCVVGHRAGGQPTLHGGPVQLRPVRATPCCGRITVNCLMHAELNTKYCHFC